MTLLLILACLRASDTVLTRQGDGVRFDTLGVVATGPGGRLDVPWCSMRSVSVTPGNVVEIELHPLEQRVVVGTMRERYTVGPHALSLPMRERLPPGAILHSRVCPVRSFTAGGLPPVP